MKGTANILKPEHVSRIKKIVDEDNVFTFQRSPRLFTNPRTEKNKRPLIPWNG
jgi:hypothetical protein